MSYGVNGWHPGELAIQAKLGFVEPATTLWHYIESTIDEYYSSYYVHQAPFVIVSVLDDDLRPWGSVLAGRHGIPGFMRSPNSQTLLIDARSWHGDPFAETLTALADGPPKGSKDRYRFLMAGLGIEFPKRERHKFAGYVRGAKRKGAGTYDLEIDLAVDQSLGNCPKYISIRKFDPHPNTNPRVVHRQLRIGPGDELPADVVNFIHDADTMFLATIYKASPDIAERFPSHAGMNHRGGNPGFMRVRADKRTLVIPDYSGNRHVSSLGNIETTGVAGITIVSYTTGDVLYLTGDARNIVGDESQRIMARQNALTTFAVTGYVLVRDALPVREREGSLTPSPYSPPIRYLREEGREVAFAPGKAPQARLKSVALHAADLATLEFELASADEPPLQVRPGQAIALGFSRLLGLPAYAHMAPFNPKSINDDRVRTWTVASAHESAVGARAFKMTMRRKDGGVVTGALFAIVHKLAAHRPALLRDARSLAFDVDVVGITGEFFLPPPGADVRLLCAAGGIGVTPFLSMIEALVARGPDTRADVVLALSTREPGVFINLVRDALGEAPPSGIRVQLDVFTHADVPALEDTVTAYGPGIVAAWHKGRIPAEYWKEVAEDREAFVCGPEPFGNAMVRAIREAGVPNERIHREGFDY